MDRWIARERCRAIRVAAWLAAVALFEGCSSPRQPVEVVAPQPPSPSVLQTKSAEKPHPELYRLKPPYTIFGVTYFPMPSAREYVEKGIASWYGDYFHGRATAAGELYDQDDLTAAHPTLPLHTVLRVTNLQNGRQAVLRVNDRGPFVKNRLIDLSRGAATALGFNEAGTALVKVEAIEPPPGMFNRITQARPEMVGVYVQVGAFRSQQKADHLARELEKLAQIRVHKAQVGEETFFRVRMGPFPSIETADSLVETLVAQGFGEGRIIVE
ncbi:MAG: septal ring lytic transglycosylase RlpA family protein [Magnetococcales bacterium]|nr:septal ring lytic transglycosylase RlpA family protein [Magnetococcales bacterium]MBF0323209.1 septal ring lytic transglycosylase RlpA family protein [Magnetococcales bacterium]